MERKPNIRENLFYPKFPKSLPQVYNKDISRIEQIYSTFISSDYEEILQIVSSGKILNFRDEEGRTLIHATLSNDNTSLTESKKLDIIKSLVNKNVSVNAMDKYNRNPLHYAADKGYTSIIEYLISIGCDKNLIDNDGNAPIHIFVDKFIADCKKNEVFDIKNKELKIQSSPVLNKINDKLKTEILSKIQIEKNQDFKNIMNFLISLIQIKKYFNEKDITNIFNQKNKEIMDFISLITKKDVTRTLESELEKILSGLENDLSGLYDSFINFDSETDFDNVDKKLLDQERSTKKSISDNSIKINKEMNELMSIVQKSFSDNYLFYDKLFKINYYMFNLSFSPFRPAGNRIEIPFDINNNYSATSPYGNFLCANPIPTDNVMYYCDGFSIFNKFNQQPNTFNNSLFFNDELGGSYMSMPLNILDRPKGIDYINPNMMLSNKFLIYDVRNQVINEKCSYNLLNLLNRQITNNPVNIFDYSTLKMITINDQLTFSSDDLDWNLDLGLGENLRGLPIITDSIEFETTDVTIPNISSNVKSLFLLSKYPKKFVPDEKRNKAENDFNIKKLKQLLGDSSKTNYLTDLFIIQDLYSIGEMDKLFIQDGQLLIPQNPVNLGALIRLNPNKSNVFGKLNNINNISNYLRPWDGRINPCGTTVPKPANNFLYDYSDGRNKDFDNLLNDPTPPDRFKHEFFKRAWIIKEIIDKNYPLGNNFMYKDPRDGIEKSIDFANIFTNPLGNNSKHIHSTISTIYNYCYKIIDMCKTNYLPILRDADFNNHSIYFNVFTFGYIKIMFTSILINFAILQDFIGDINLEIFNEIILELKDFIGDPNLNEYSRKMFKEHLSFLFEDLNKEHMKYFKFFKEKKYEDDFKKIYEKILEILTLFNEQSNQFDKLQSITYSKKLLEYLRNPAVPQSIDNFYYNKFNIDYKNGFTDNFNNWINKYIPDISNFDYKLITQELYPYYYQYDYNKIFHLINDPKWMLKLLDIKKQYTQGVDVIQVLDANGDPQLNPINYQITFPIEFKLFNLQYNISEEYDVMGVYNVIKSILRPDKFKFGYYDIAYDETNPDPFYDNKKDYDSKYFNRRRIRLLNANIDDSPPYICRFVGTKTGFSISDLSKNSLSMIGLLNCKEIINLMAIDFTNKLLSSANIDTYFDFTVENLALDQKEKEQFELIINEIKSNDELKRKIISGIVNDYFKMIVISQKNIEAQQIYDQYIDSKKSILENLTKFNIRLPKYSPRKLEIELKNIIEEKNPTLELMFAEIDKEQLFSQSTNQVKIIGNKCVDLNMVDKIIHMNMRIEDINGNTILNKLIYQYNIYGIKKILCIDSALRTYKNSRDETPLVYLETLIKTIQSEYIRGLESRINQYGEVLQNQINQSEKYKELSLDEEEKVVFNLILMCIYMFNEFIWMKMYSFPNGWTLNNKMQICRLLQVGPENENLLIKLFNDEDERELEQESVEFINKRYSEQFKSILQEEIDDLNNKIAELDKARTDSKLLTDIDDLKLKYETLKSEKENKILELSRKQTKLVSNVSHSIVPEIDNYKNDLIKQNVIDYEKYDELVVELRDVYYKMIKLLNKKVDKITVSDDRTIANSQLLLMNLSAPIIKSNVDLLNNYNKKIIDSIYAEFEDLDKYDDTEYNTVNMAMLNIIKINVINVISEELSKLLFTYFISNYDSLYIQKVKANPKGASPDAIKEGLFIVLKDYLYTSANVKLKTINPDKDISLDLIRARVVKNIYKIFGIITFEFDSEEFNEVMNLINFYSDVSDNISLNAYEEMIKLLVNLKKISLLEEIQGLLNLSDDELKKICV